MKHFLKIFLGLVLLSNIAFGLNNVFAQFPVDNVGVTEGTPLDIESTSTENYVFDRGTNTNLPTAPTSNDPTENVIIKELDPYCEDGYDLIFNPDDEYNCPSVNMIVDYGDYSDAEGRTHCCKCPSGQYFDSDKRKCVEPAGLIPIKEPEYCEDGVKLNTNVPFIGDCITTKSAGSTNTTSVNPTTAFPRLIGGLSKIMITVILITSFIMLIAAGVLIASSGSDSGRYSDGKKMIIKVIVGIMILGASGVILKIINPNFFG